MFFVFGVLFGDLPVLILIDSSCSAVCSTDVSLIFLVCNSFLSVSIFKDIVLRVILQSG